VSGISALGAGAAGVKSMPGGMAGLSLGPSATAGAAGRQLPDPMLGDPVACCQARQLMKDLAAAARQAGRAGAAGWAGNLGQAGESVAWSWPSQLQAAPGGWWASQAGLGRQPLQAFTGLGATCRCSETRALW